MLAVYTSGARRGVGTTGRPEEDTLVLTITRRSEHAGRLGTFEIFYQVHLFVSKKLFFSKMVFLYF